MAVTNPPGWLQNAGSTHTAPQLRTYLAGLQAGVYSAATNLRARGGVHPALGQELVVTQAGSPNMTVLVEPGVASIPGTESATQGNYFVCNDAQATLSVTAAHATLPRIDIVVLNVRDAQYSGANNDSQLQVVAGTAASSPVAPTAPVNSIIIAQIAVGAAVTSIVNANITDTRFYLAAVGGVIPIRNIGAIPTSAEMNESQLLWAMDTNILYVWDGSAANQVFPSYVKIAESVLGSAAASITFSSIPSTYRELAIEMVCRGSNASQFVPVNLRFNNDSGAIYDYVNFQGSNGGAAASETLSQTSMYIGDMPANTAMANSASIHVVKIPWYANTTFFKNVVTSQTSDIRTTAGTAGQLFSKLEAGVWRSTTAINRIDLLSSAGNFVTGSSFALYGIV